MKNALLVILAVAGAASLTACGGGSDGNLPTPEPLALNATQAASVAAKAPPPSAEHTGLKEASDAFQVARPAQGQLAEGLQSVRVTKESMRDSQLAFLEREGRITAKERQAAMHLPQDEYVDLLQRTTKELASTPEKRAQLETAMQALTPQGR